MIVRLLQQSDLSQYKDLRLRSLQTDPDAYFTQYRHIIGYGDSFFASEIQSQSPIYGYYGAFVDETLDAYVSLTKPYFPVQFHIADIYNLYVEPALRGKGLATQLLEFAIKKAQAQKIEALFLSVMHTNTPAITLYTKFGFIEYGRKPQSVKKEDRYFDEILMMKSLDHDKLNK